MTQHLGQLEKGGKEALVEPECRRAARGQVAPHCHPELVTQAHTHTTLLLTTLSSKTQHCHPQLCHTQTHNSLTRTPSHPTRLHTTLSCSTLSHTHNSVTHSSSQQPVFHHILPLPSHFRMCYVLGAYWKQLTCGVIQHFHYFCIQKRGYWQMF